MKQELEWRQARDLLLAETETAGEELLPLEEAAGRRLARPQWAGYDMPPFDRSPYDGYAFQSGDTMGALPVILRVIEEVPAGTVPKQVVTAGTAVKVLTGAPIPPGADAVTKFEETEFTPTSVTLRRSYLSGENLIRQGEDLRAGDMLAQPGQILDAGLSGALWAQGVREVWVYRRPRVGVITTGSELRDEGAPGSGGQIPNSNRPALMAALALAGAEPVFLGAPKDDLADITALLAEAVETCDLVVTTGGVSVGDYDLTPAALEGAGAELLLQDIAIKPGGKCCFGRKGKTLACCLSGNPASALTCFYAVVLPALRRSCGHPQGRLPEVRARLAGDYPKASPRTRLLRGRLRWGDRELEFVPCPTQGNGALHTLAGANALAEISAGSGPVPGGTLIRAIYIGT